MRCASYPDVRKFVQERVEIEKSWPAYATDNSMCQVPDFIVSHADLTQAHVLNRESPEDWAQEGKEWANLYNVTSTKHPRLSTKWLWEREALPYIVKERVGPETITLQRNVSKHLGGSQNPNPTLEKNDGPLGETLSINVKRKYK